MPKETLPPGVTGASSVPTGSDIATTALQDKLVSSAEAISSFSTGAEKATEDMIANTKLATQKGSAAIASAFEREKAFMAGKGETALTTAAESERGYGRVLGTYRELAGNTDKEIKDLEQRKQELIMQNDAAGLKEVNTLITNSLTFKQNAMQQTFSNLLGIAGFSTQQRAQQMAEKAQTFTEKSNIAGIAMKYGVAVKPGDTLDTVLAKIPAGTVTKEEAMNLAKMSSEINLNNARAAEALAGKVSLSDTPANIDALATAARRDTVVLASIDKNPSLLAKVRNKVVTDTQTDVTNQALSSIQSGISKEDLKKKITDDPSAYWSIGTFAAQDIVDNVYAKNKKVVPEKTYRVGPFTDWMLKNIYNE